MIDDTPYEYEVAKDEIFATIRLEELQELVDDSAFLQMLMNNGLTTWDKYDFLKKTFKDKQNGHPFFLISSSE